MKRNAYLNEIDPVFRTETGLRWLRQDDTSTQVILMGMRLELPPADAQALPRSVTDTVFVNCDRDCVVTVLEGEETYTQFQFTVGGPALAGEAVESSVKVVWSGFTAHLNAAATLTVWGEVAQVSLEVSQITTYKLLQGDQEIDVKAGLGLAVAKLLSQMSLVSYDLLVADIERVEDESSAP